MASLWSNITTFVAVNIIRALSVGVTSASFLVGWLLTMIIGMAAFMASSVLIAIGIVWAATMIWKLLRTSCGI